MGKIKIQTKLEGSVRANKSFWQLLLQQRQLVILSVPFLGFGLVFNYLPIWGWIMAFQNYRPHKGIWGSAWVGLNQFKELFSDMLFIHSLRNTLAISSLKLVMGFTCSIMLALLINEVKNLLFKRSIQTAVYLPHFVSWVVAASLIKMSLSPEDGFVSIILQKLNIVGEATNIMAEKNYFWILVAVSDVWKEVGWGTIVYLSAMSGIDPQLYEAAFMDGAGRIRRILSITLPCIAPTIKILIILSIGSILTVGFDQIFLLRNDIVAPVSDTIEMYIYKYGIGLQRWSLSTASGMFNSLVGLILVFAANRISRKIDGERAF